MDGFFGIGIGELFLIAVVALVVLGPERLPGALRELAKFIKTIRQMTNELTSQFGDEFKVLEELNPQKILRDLVDDPDEKAKAAAKTTTVVKPAAKPAAKPASTTAKPATTTTKPATTTTKPATTTPKPAAKPASTKATAAASTGAASTTVADPAVATVEEAQVVEAPVQETPAATLTGEVVATEIVVAETAVSDATDSDATDSGATNIEAAVAESVVMADAQAQEDAVAEIDALEIDTLEIDTNEPVILPPALQEALVAEQAPVAVEAEDELAASVVDDEASDDLSPPELIVEETSLSPVVQAPDVQEVVSIDEQPLVVEELPGEDASAETNAESIAKIAKEPPQSLRKSTNVNGAHVNGTATENEA